MRQVLMTFFCVAALSEQGCFLWNKSQQKVDCSQQNVVFSQQVEPLLQSTCVTCHTAGGLAATSGFVLAPGTTADIVAKNQATFAAVSAIKQGGTSIVLLKPTGVIAHTGGKLAPPGSAAYNALEKMVSLNQSCAAATADGGAAPGGPQAPIAPAYVSARVRRLTNAEFDSTVQALLGTSQRFGQSFTNDARQDGFTRNADAIVDSIAAPQIQTAADALALEAVTNQLNTIAPCTGSNQTTCATSFITNFGAKAFRRPLTSDEIAALLTVYQAGIVDQAYADGIQLTLSAMLQSANFLYLTEIGDGSVTSGPLQLTPYETASALSYFITGGPPDATLLQAAAVNALATGDQRAAQAQRLLALPAAKNQLAQFVEQWLHIDSPISTTLPTTTLASMVTETNSFVGEVMLNDDGTLAKLLTADYTFVDATLASFYGLPAGSTGKVSTGGQRIGIFNQGSFLANYAHGDLSAPTKRGHVVRSELLCQEIPPPDPSLMVDMTVTAPPANSTTRESTSAHLTSPACASCHQLMDPIGFGFEHFDGNGAYRATESGLPIDDSGTINAGGSVTGDFSDGQAMLARLAGSTDAVKCFDLFFFRFASAQNSPSTEAAFTNFLALQPLSRQSRLVDLLVAFVKSDLFATRSL
jgi:hypothetical protein